MIDFGSHFERCDLRSPGLRCDNPVYRESAAATELLGTRWVTCAITAVCDEINVVKP